MLKIILAILLFSLIVLFHELGHFLFAKKNGVYVEEFALGLGPNLIGFQKGETYYSLKLLPFGGCCVMLGEDGEETDPRALSNKTPLQRFWVIFGGPLFNFILAFFLSLIVIGYGGSDPTIVGKVEPNGGAYEAGIQVGDEITRIDGSKIYNFREISLYNYTHVIDPKVDITYVRDGKEYETTITRKKTEDGYFILGISAPGNHKENLFGIIKYSFLEVRYQIKTTFTSLFFLCTGQISMKDLSGPVGIVNMIGETYDQSIIYGVITMLISLLDMAIMLSANLGVMNLLPLPALDGGRLVFIILEMIRGKKIDPDKEGTVHFVGIILLMALMIFIMFNDILNIIS